MMSDANKTINLLFREIKPQIIIYIQV